MNGYAAAVVSTALVVNALAGFGYRVYRRRHGGPVADVWGQAVLGVVLLAIAGGVAGAIGWARWVAVGYALLFGVIVMPLWTLAVLIPSDPRALDYWFTATYWAALATIAVAGIAG
ncbi:MAG TPA: hypothetical protein VNC78_07490 [Actinomycetota bacterium]|nr:hypothetical protein [Actinomycetota bacterium]